MKDAHILKFFSSLGAWSVEKKVQVLGNVEFLKQLERDPKFVHFLEQVVPSTHLPKRPLPTTGSIEVWPTMKTALLRDANGTEVTSLWSWHPRFREALEAVLGPCTVYQWDWTEGEKVWTTVATTSETAPDSLTEIPLTPLIATPVPKAVFPPPPPANAPKFSSDDRLKFLEKLQVETQLDPFLETLRNYLRCTFSSGVVFLVEGTTVAGWAGYGVFSPPTTLSEFQVKADQPSLFRIALQSLQPYHGHIAKTKEHVHLFQHFKATFPEHVTLLPCIHKGEALLLIGGVCTRSEGLKLDLYTLFEEAQIIGAQFVRLSELLAVA